MSLSAELVRITGERERRLYARHGLIIRVSSVAHDDRTLLCTVFQQRRVPLLKPMEPVQMVLLAESVLAPLLNSGFTPMITAIDWAHGEELRNSADRPDPQDPLGLLSALRDAGLPFPRLNSTGEENGDDVVFSFPLWRKALGVFTLW